MDRARLNYQMPATEEKSTTKVEQMEILVQRELRYQSATSKLAWHEFESEL